MSNYWFLYNTTTGAITETHLTTAEQWTNIPSGQGVIGPYPQATASATVQDAYNNPNRYLVQNGTLMLQPYFTITSTSTAITATLNNPPTPAPTSATFTIAGTNFTANITNNVATLTYSLKSEIANQAISVQATALGCVAGTGTIGGSSVPSANLMAKANADGSVTIKTTSKSEVKNYYFAHDPSSVDILTDIGNMDDVFASMLGKLMTWAQNATYAPLSLTADEQNAITQFNSQYVPLLRVKLADMAPATGSQTVQNNRWPAILSHKSTINTNADSCLSSLSDPDVTKA